MKYFAVGPFCWGKGESIDEALKNCKKQWPGPPYTGKKFDKNKVQMFKSEEKELKMNVDDMGRITGPSDMVEIKLT